VRASDVADCFVEECDECETTGRNCALHGGPAGMSAYLAPDGEIDESTP
jgi:hypothetical protein